MAIVPHRNTLSKRMHRDEANRDTCHWPTVLINVVMSMINAGSSWPSGALAVGQKRGWNLHEG